MSSVTAAYSCYFEDECKLSELVFSTRVSRGCDDYKQFNNQMAAPKQLRQEGIKALPGSRSVRAATADIFFRSLCIKVKLEYPFAAHAAHFPLHYEFWDFSCLHMLSPICNDYSLYLKVIIINHYNSSVQENRYVIEVNYVPMARCNHVLIRDLPLFGCIAFGIIDRGTNVLQVRPISECPLSCVFCSTDAGARTSRRISEYMVDLHQMFEAFDRAASYKGTDEIEAHVDTVGEPAMYPHLAELIEGLAKNCHVKTVSMQTNGMMLDSGLIDELDRAGLSRVNMSIESIDPGLAKTIAGTNAYDLGRVLDNARHIVDNTGIDLLIAPVWLPGLNDGEIPKLIEFALDAGAGKRFPALGIQKFLPHKYGRKPGIRTMGWDEFYSRLHKWEGEFGTKLVLSPGDFGSFDCRALPRVFKRDEKVKMKVVGPGWMKGEKLAVARDRVVTLVDADRIKVGSEVNARIERAVDGIYIARADIR